MPNALDTYGFDADTSFDGFVFKHAEKLLEQFFNGASETFEDFEMLAMGEYMRWFDALDYEQRVIEFQHGDRDQVEDDDDPWGWGDDWI